MNEKNKDIQKRQILVNDGDINDRRKTLKPYFMGNQPQGVTQSRDNKTDSNENSCPVVFSSESLLSVLTKKAANKNASGQQYGCSSLLPLHLQTGRLLEVKYKGKNFTIQTEDLGVKRALVITELYSKGALLSVKKDSYKNHIGSDDMILQVAQLIDRQHKEMLIDLKNGHYKSNVINKEKEPVKKPAFAKKLKVDAAAIKADHSSKVISPWDCAVQRTEDSLGQKNKFDYKSKSQVDDEPSKQVSLNSSHSTDLASDSQAKAVKFFEEGLALVFKKDLQGAQQLWLMASALDQTNSKYRTNLKRLQNKLKKQ